MQYQVFSSQTVSQEGMGEEPQQLCSNWWQLRHEIRNNWQKSKRQMSENILFLTLFLLYKSDFPSQFDEEKHLFQSSLGKINKHSVFPTGFG